MKQCPVLSLITKLLQGRSLPTVSGLLQESPNEVVQKHKPFELLFLAQYVVQSLHLSYVR